MLAINPKIKQKAEDIRKKIFGSEVRESLASGLEEMSEDVESIKSRQDAVEQYNNQMIAEMTDKDVISAPEIIAARGGKTTLGQRLDETNTQLAQAINYTEMAFSTMGTRKKGKRPIVSFIFDDGAIKDYTDMKPIVENKNIPVGLGIVTSWAGSGPNYMNWEQIAEMEAIGCEIMAHSHKHRDSATLSESVLEEDVSTNLNILREKGYNPTGFIYPFNSSSLVSRRVLAKYYDMVFSKSNRDRQGKNYPTIRNIEIERVALGSFFDTPMAEFPEDTSTLAYYKARVDECKNNDNWLVFVLHPASTDATQRQYFEEVIDYVKGQGIDIVSPRDGFDIYGNIIEIRGDKTVIMDADGGFTMSTDNRVVFDRYNGRKNSDSVTEYLNEKTTLTAISSSHASAEGFPEGVGGYLKTDRISSDYYHAKQEYTATLGTGRTYVRYANPDYSWKEWVSGGAQDTVYVSGTNAYTPTSKWVSFPIGRITHTPITSSFASSNGFPFAQGGLLTTYRLTSDYWLGKQEYRIGAILHSSTKETVWERFVDSALNWTAWRRKGQLFFDVTSNSFIVNAQATHDLQITGLTGMSFNDIVTAVPFGSSSLPAGIVHSVYRTNTDTVTIRFANVTASSVSVSSVRWSITVDPIWR